MSEKSSISVKSAILYGVAIVVVAFIGVLLGNWFVEWRRTSQIPPMPDIQDWQTANQSTLVFGDPFPNEELLDLDSNTVTMDSLIAGKKVIIALISPGCGPCGAAIEVWNEEVKALPDDISFFAMAVGDVVEIRAYRDKNAITFPVYCDPAMLYLQQYDLTSFPTVIGLNDSGKVVLVWHGFHPERKYSLADYYNFIVSSGKTEEVDVAQ